jgi:flagellin
MRINTNIMAINAQNKLSVNQRNVEGSIKNLSSGLRINSAADDASGLAISEKMRAQIRGLAQAKNNAQDGISMIQTAEGALQQTTDILQRMRELVIKSQNTGVLTEDDRVSVTTELAALRDEIDRIATSSTFNSKKLLDGSLATQLDSTTVDENYSVSVANAEEETTYSIEVNDGKAKITWGTDNSEELTLGQTISGVVRFASAGIEINLGKDSVATADALNGKTITTKAETDTSKRAVFKIGANTFEEDLLFIGIDDMSSKGLSATNEKMTIAIATNEEANSTLEAIDYAIDKVSAQRSVLGAMQNRMEYAVENLTATHENLTNAESRIRDVDMAQEMVTYTKNSILNQSAMAMLAQANQQPQAILSLLS